MSSPAVPRARILLDQPSPRPVLNFGETAAALAGIIEHSDAQFSVGIFGGWGSGKTTLMNAIRERLTPASIITVEFNAWRFEKESLLLVPLLDTIRGALLAWSATAPAAGKERARKAARRVARVVRALVGGLSAEVGISGAAKITYDVGSTLDRLVANDEESPQSLYVAAFQELREAFAELSQKGARRVVVFVDDLDRCLPSNALDVLESMKLFFDLEGFVFVVGLDEDVVQRAVRARFRVEGAPQSAGTAAEAEADRRLERDYVEKIFQVPYRLPPIVDRQLGELLDAMYREGGLPPEQLMDLQDRAHRYLRFVAVEGRVNPREVKRFVNTYTLQTLVRPDLDPDTVLALQTLLARHEWRSMYDSILVDSPRFIAALDRFRRDKDDRAFEDLSPELASLPSDLAEFLASEPADALRRHPSLDAFLSSLETTRVTTPTWLAVAYREIGRLRAAARQALRGEPTTATAANNLRAVTGEVASVLSSALAETTGRRGPDDPGVPIPELLRRLETTMTELASSANESSVPAAAQRVQDIADEIYRELRRYR